MKEKTVQWLEQSRLSHGAVEAYATPRRLSVLVQGVAEKQDDVEEEVKGPFPQNRPGRKRETGAKRR
ncbi:glycine--tRNA ligase subunit beta [Paenibacillus sp. JTLBN-2024]